MKSSKTAICILSIITLVSLGKADSTLAGSFCTVEWRGWSQGFVRVCQQTNDDAQVYTQPSPSAPSPQSFPDATPAKGNCLDAYTNRENPRSLTLTTTWNNGQRYVERVFLKKVSGTTYFGWFDTSGANTIWFPLVFNSEGHFYFNRGNNWQLFSGGRCQLMFNGGTEVVGEAFSYPNNTGGSFTLR
ncbi:MAG: hypothetical protein LW851_10655 [Pseudanabaena sp. CoA8_M7]|jgi:hypothetical protein|nr:hypothetical protein [Pseudanabaena sp. M007S1SP1A06QC]MCE2976740.1 hypothetical protein [Pseudanabaena sp. CoA8_M7]